MIGSNKEEWMTLAKAVTEAGADMLELIFSCPQMTSHAMGSDVGQNPELVRTYPKAVVDHTHPPVVGGISGIEVSCNDGAHQAIAWNSETRKPKILIGHRVGCPLCLNVCPGLPKRFAVFTSPSGLTSYSKISELSPLSKKSLHILKLSFIIRKIISFLILKMKKFSLRSVI